MATKAKKSESAAPKKSRKSSKKEEVVVEVTVAAIDETLTQPVGVCHNDFLNRLREKLTFFDAKLILDAALVTAGVPQKDGNYLKGEAKNICLALIKRGGPAYSVGAGIYREVIN